MPCSRTCRGTFPMRPWGIPADYRWARGRVEVPIWYWQGHAVWGYDRPPDPGHRPPPGIKSTGRAGAFARPCLFRMEDLCAQKLRVISDELFPRWPVRRRRKAELPVKARRSLRLRRGQPQAVPAHGAIVHHCLADQLHAVTPAPPGALPLPAGGSSRSPAPIPGRRQRPPRPQAFHPDTPPVQAPRRAVPRRSPPTPPETPPAPAPGGGNRGRAPVRWPAASRCILG